MLYKTKKEETRKNEGRYIYSPKLEIILVSLGFSGFSGVSSFSMDWPRFSDSDVLIFVGEGGGGGGGGGR